MGGKHFRNAPLYKNLLFYLRSSETLDQATPRTKDVGGEGCRTTKTVVARISIRECILQFQSVGITRKGYRMGLSPNLTFGASSGSEHRLSETIKSRLPAQASLSSSV